MKMIERLKSRNRTLLEVDLGILFWALAASAVGSLLPMGRWGLERADYLAALWAAVPLTFLGFLHMQRCLEKALDWDEKTAAKVVYQGYILRYACFGVILAAAAVTGILDPVVLCLGYLLLMKVAVYSQPFTHKLCNKLFHETDPEPEALSDEELQAWNEKSI